MYRWTLYICLYFLLTVAISGCGETKPEVQASNTSTGVLASDFSLLSMVAFDGPETIEASMYYSPSGELLAWTDPDMKGSIEIKKSLDNGVSWTSHYSPDLPHMRFPYTWQSGSEYLTLAHMGGTIHMYTSVDGLDWNYSNTVQRPNAGTRMNHLYNATGVVSNGLLHLYTEGSEVVANQGGLGLFYNAGPLGSELDNSTGTLIIPNGGNAQVLQDSLGRTLLLYGKVNERTAKWEIHFSTVPAGADLSDPSNYTSHDSDLAFVHQTIHLADPHIVETPAGLRLSFSYDQRHSVMYSTDFNLVEFINRLQGVN